MKAARGDGLQLFREGGLDDMAAYVKEHGFEALDKSSKEMSEDIDDRLKWVGFFHRRKQHYGTFMCRIKVPNGISNSEQLRFLAKTIAKYETLH